MPDDKDILAVGLLVIGICFASALAAWDPSSILGNHSPIILDNPPSKNLALKLNVSSIDWGILFPGGASYRGLLVTSTGNASGVLGIKAQNWQPQNAQQFMRLSWDYAGAALAPGSPLELSLILTISQNISGIYTFSFDIVISIA
jgi:hypothetical protein